MVFFNSSLIRAYIETFEKNDTLLYISTLFSAATMPDFENRPLPGLPDGLRHDVEAACWKAHARLSDELDRCWRRAFPRKKAHQRNPQPDDFFRPFQVYAVACYDAWADAILKIDPSQSDYLAWLNYSLKTHVCEQISPTARMEWANYGERKGAPPCGEWHLAMGRSFRLLDRPAGDIDSAGWELVNSIDNVEAWTRLYGSLHKAISRRTEHWYARLLEREASRQKGDRANAQPKRLGRKPREPIDGEAVRRARGTLSQEAFARLCDISADTLQIAEQGSATSDVKNKIEAAAENVRRPLSAKKPTAKNR